MPFNGRSLTQPRSTTHWDARALYISLITPCACLRHSRDNPDFDPGHGRTLQVPHHPEVVLVAGVAGVGDEHGRGVDRHGNHVRVQPGSAPGGAVSGIFSPQETEPGSLLKSPQITG